MNDSMGGRGMVHRAINFKYINLLRFRKRIYLLSHMRANTSLLGHIMGSHPQIEGYYELHKGYGRRLDLLKNKLVYYDHHAPKTRAVYLFDKLLHNYLPLSERLVEPHDRVIFMIREPAPSIISIMKLFSNDAQSKWATRSGAEDYYTKRLERLKDLAIKFRGRYFFLRAEDLVNYPDKALEQLSRYLDLKTNLSKDYQIFEKTGEKGAGDCFSNLKSGTIVPKFGEHPRVPEPDNSLREIYLDTLKTLTKNSMFFLSS